MILSCPECPKEWDYTGDNNVYATCPDCKHSVKIEDHTVDTE